MWHGGGVDSGTPPLIELGTLARRIGVAASIVAVLAAAVATAIVDVAAGLDRVAVTWLGLVLVGLGPTALALTAGSAIVGLRRARRRGESLSDRAGVAPPQLRRR